MRSGSAGGVLTVTVSPAFAAKWLLPRIERFQAARPETDLRLDTSPEAGGLLAQRIDVGVRYGRGQWPGLAAEKLMDEEVYPGNCAPALLATATLQAPGDLRGRCSSMTSPSRYQHGFCQLAGLAAPCGVQGAHRPGLAHQQLGRRAAGGH